MSRSRLLLLAVLLWPVSASAFEGKYDLNRGSLRGEGSITRGADGNFVAKFEIGVPGCIGDVDAAGRASGGVLRLRAVDEFAECDLEVRETATGIDLKEIGRCNMRGGGCSFNSAWTKVGGRTKTSENAGAGADGTVPAKPPKPRKLAGNFYCSDETRLQKWQIEDPTYRTRPPKGATVSPMDYDFYFHGGTLAVSEGGDTTTFRGVKVSFSGDSAVYVGQKGAKWAVNPVGARNFVIVGTGLSGPTQLYACSWR
jgi:hypothetical protein